MNELDRLCGTMRRSERYGLKLRVAEALNRRGALGPVVESLMADPRVAAGDMIRADIKSVAKEHAQSLRNYGSGFLFVLLIKIALTVLFHFLFSSHRASEGYVSAVMYRRMMHPTRKF